MSQIQLTPPQLQAAHTIDRSIGIVANAGSGKTRVLVERVIHILNFGTAKLHNILLVTFTEKAAQELRERLAKRLAHESRLELIGATITTFHGFATRVLQEHAPAARLPAAFRVASEGEAASLLHRAVETSILKALDTSDAAAVTLCRQFKFRSLVRHMMPLLEDRWSFEHYLAQSSEQAGTLAAIVALFQRCAGCYNALKNEQSLLDFHDLEIEVWRLFQNDPRILSDYQRQFHHIMVDEFQDTNPLQTAIVRQLYTASDNILCIVGDPKQSIYRFRRADVRCFSGMLAHIVETGGEAIVLPDNFRSTPEVVSFTNAVCTEIPNYTPLIAHREPSSVAAVMPIVIQHEQKLSADERRIHEIKAVIEILPELIRHHGDPSKIACLFQTRNTLQLWADALRAQNFPVHVYSSGGFWERPEIQALLTALHVLCGILQERPDERHLLAMLISPLFSVSLDDIYRWRHMLPQTSGPWKTAPLHAAVANHSTVGHWLESLREQVITLTPHEILKHIVQSRDYLAVLNHRDPGGQMAANVESLLRRVHRMTRDHAMTLPDTLDQLVELRDRGERVPDSPATTVHDHAIQLMTIHAAKGNEFPAVILADCLYEPLRSPPAWLFEPAAGFAIKYENELDPHHVATEAWETLAQQYQLDAFDERHRLLYVALTRAENQLVIPVHPDRIRDAPKETPRNWHDILAPLALSKGAPS